MKQLCIFLLRLSWWGTVAAAVGSLLSGLLAFARLALVNALVANPNLLGVPWFVGVCVLSFLVANGAFWIQARLTLKGLQALDARLARRVLEAPLSQLESVGPSRLLAALNDDVGALGVALSTLPVVVSNTAIVVAALAYLGWLSPVILAGTVMIVVAGVVSTRFVIRLVEPLQVKARGRLDERQSLLLAIVHGAKELRLQAKRRAETLAAFEGNLEEVARLNLTAQTLGNSLSPLTYLVIFVGLGLLAVIGAKQWAIGRETLGAACLAIFYMTSGISFLLNSLPPLSRGAIALRALERLGLTFDSESRVIATGAAPAPAPQVVELRGVSHKYFREGEDRAFTLGPVDLTVNAGEILFVVGGNGSGKSTLAKVLVGLYAPDGGSVLVDGKPVADADRDSYRQYFAVIFSDFFLFDNIHGLGREDRDANSYLRKLLLHERVTIQDGKFSTTALSQGQKKRLALVAAYLEDRAIYLFDEWAADQDPVFKATFYNALLPELRAKGKAVVVISHDDAYFHVADRLVRLEDGRIVETTRPQRADSLLHVSASAAD